MPKRGRYGERTPGGAYESQEGDEQGGTRMPKLRRYGERGGGQEGLYLVFDDWYYGYSIRKVNLSPCGNNQQPAVSSKAARRLPKPFNRLVAPRGSPKYFTSAFGTRILAMHPRDPDAFPMLDVRSRGITFGPGQGRPVNPIYLPVGKKLFTLSIGSFEMLCLEELRPPPPGRSCGMEWSWKELSGQPFDVYDVTSYSLHPRKRTFLVSTKMDATEATFTFDTVKLEWKRLGNWALPFTGRGHFDLRLKGFVGLSKDPDTLGQLYSCYAPSSYTGEGQCPAPLRVLCKEKLFSEDPAHRHVGATLVYMGCRSKFCLIQCLSVEHNSADQQHKDDDDSADQALIKEGDVRLPGRCMYRLTTFSLSRDKNGDLTTGNSRQVQYYRVPISTSRPFLIEDPVVFWV